jgi:hypothetical protein
MPHIVYKIYPCCWGLWWHSWVRHCATSQKIASLISDCVTGIFHWHYFSHTLWQKWVPGLFPGGKSSQCTGLRTLPPSCLDIWEPQSPGTLRACPDQYRDSFTLTLNLLLQMVCVATYSLHMLHAFSCCVFCGNRVHLKLETLLWWIFKEYVQAHHHSHLPVSTPHFSVCCHPVTKLQDSLLSDFHFSCGYCTWTL